MTPDLDFTKTSLEAGMKSAVEKVVQTTGLVWCYCHDPGDDDKKMMVSCHPKADYVMEKGNTEPRKLERQ